MIEYLGNFHVFFTLATKKVLIFLDFPMKNMVKVFGIPMCSLGGVHLISGIAQYTQFMLIECHRLWWTPTRRYTNIRGKSPQEHLRYI